MASFELKYSIHHPLFILNSFLSELGALEAEELDKI